MGCKIVNPINGACGDLIYPGGADAVFYVGYVSDLSQRISTLQTGDIANLSFLSYVGLKKMEGSKFVHQFSSEILKGTGGNIAFTHRAILKLVTQSTQDDVEIQRMAQATDMFIVYANNNEQLFILGATKGLSVVAGALQSTGVAAGDDVADGLTLEGVEKTKPLRFSAGTYTQSIALLDSYIR